MTPIARAPPVVGLALVFGAGSACIHLGVPLPWTLLPLPLLLCLVSPFHRPRPPLVALLLAWFAGSVSTWAWQDAETRDCRITLQEGRNLHLLGRMVGTPVRGVAEFRPNRDASQGFCAEALRVVLPNTHGPPPDAGAPMELYGVWRRTPSPRRTHPLRAGYLKVDSLVAGAEGSGGSMLRDPGDLRVRAGAWVQRRLEDLYPRTSGLAVALIWARKDGLDPSVREAFARTGTAHLLAISGFHVGVVAGVLLLLLGSVGLPHLLRYALATAGVWIYVATIGMPHAAVRAALILLVLSLGRFWNRPVSSLGALATTFLVFALCDPGALSRPGFQLSFAGATGLALWYRSLAARLTPDNAGGISRALVSGLAAGIVATLATLPLVAWHFGRVSLVGIPVSLLAAPLVTLAIPGVFASLLLAFVHPGLGRLAAQGPDVILQALSLLVRGCAFLPFASTWISRPAVISGTMALGAGLIWLRLRPRGGWPGRVGILGLAVLCGVLAWPVGLRLVQGRSLEIVALDVGQGDAIAIRSPRGRWILVDAGPKTETYDAGARKVLPYLRSRGARALGLMVLTHPDMDHVGGAAAVLREFPVQTVADPGDPAGSDVFIQALLAAMEAGVPWGVLGAGDSLQIDGMALRILAPESPGVDSQDGGRGEEGNNARSLVMELRYGAFAALLTGDATALSETRYMSRLLSRKVQVLKVGHHGSLTSTSRPLLERAGPEIALISAGRRNRFGHPHGPVLDRLQEFGVSIFRTDLDGDVVVRATPDGNFRVHRVR